MIAEEFFRERVRAALSPEANEYLVGVLSGFVRDTPELGMVGYRYLASLGPERIVVLKEVGDTSLFLIGFFPECRPVRAAGQRYFSGIGRSAYGELGTRFRGDAGRVFGELSAGFTSAVCAIARVRESLAADRLRALEERLLLAR